MLQSRLERNLCRLCGFKSENCKLLTNNNSLHILNKVRATFSSVVSVYIRRPMPSNSSVTLILTNFYFQFVFLCARIASTRENTNSCFQIYKDDPLPQRICKECEQNVNQFYERVQRYHLLERCWRSQVQATNPSDPYLRVYDANKVSKQTRGTMFYCLFTQQCTQAKLHMLSAQ